MKSSRGSVRSLFSTSVLLLAVGAALGQEQAQPQIISLIEFQTPKAGMSKEYEEGRRAKAEWHRQQEDTWPLFVWEVVSGDKTGQYVVGVFGREWRDFDAPVVPEAANTKQFEEKIAPYTESVTTRFYTYLSEVSRPGQFVVPSPLA